MKPLKTLDIPAGDARALRARAFLVAEVCRELRVPEAALRDPVLVPNAARGSDPVCVVSRRGPGGEFRPVRTFLHQPRRKRGEPATPAFRDHEPGAHR